MGFFKKFGGLVAGAVANPAAALAGLSLGSDLIAANQDRKAAQGAHNAEMQMALNNMAMQKEFAQNGIRWRTEDAIAAGLHPLAALGAQGPSFSPIQVGGGGDPGRGDSFRAMSKFGQDISRSMMAMATPEEKRYKDLQLQYQQKQNDLLDLEILERRKAFTAPGTSAAGTPSSFNQLVDTQPTRRSRTMPGQSFLEAGSSPGITYTQMPNGWLMANMPQQLAEQTEDDKVSKALWTAMVRGGEIPPPDRRFWRLPPGKDAWLPVQGGFFKPVTVSEWNRTMRAEKRGQQYMDVWRGVGQAGSNFWKRTRQLHGGN